MEKKVKSINVEDDEFMVLEGLRLPVVKPRDFDVWVKSPRDRSILKVVKNKLKLTTRNWCSPIYQVGVKGKLVVHLKNSPKSTVSYSCYRSDIPVYLNKCAKKSDIVSFSFNGISYGADDTLPRLKRNMRLA